MIKPAYISCLDIVLGNRLFELKKKVPILTFFQNSKSGVCEYAYFLAVFMQNYQKKNIYQWNCKKK